MLDHAARIRVLLGVLRASGRLLLCLTLLLLPVYGVSAAHFETAIGTHHDHGGGDGAPTKSDHAPLCHQLGACTAFLAPNILEVARACGARLPAPPAARQPVSAAQHPLFRPPIPGA